MLFVNEVDVCGVFFFCCGEVVFFGDGVDFWFF